MYPERPQSEFVRGLKREAGATAFRFIGLIVVLLVSMVACGILT